MWWRERKDLEFGKEITKAKYSKVPRLYHSLPCLPIDRQLIKSENALLLHRAGLHSSASAYHHSLVQATLLYTATVYSYSTEHRLQKARSCVVRCLPWWLSSLPSSREVLLLPAYGPTPTCGTPSLFRPCLVIKLWDQNLHSKCPVTL
jgi:hypothetical protein